MKTYQATSKDIKREWHLVDAKGRVLGRLASEIALLLMGKGKRKCTPNIDAGDYVVVINAKEVLLTGKKAEQKVYFKHSGYRGGAKEVRFSEIIKKFPDKVIKHAVSGMLPNNKLKAKRLRRLKVFGDQNHPYTDKFK